MQLAPVVPGQRVLLDRVSIRQFVAANNAIFNKRMQNILNQNFDQMKTLAIFQKSNDPTPNIFYFRADRYQEELRQTVEDFITKQIDHFYNNSDQTYAIAYVHSTFFDFLAFRRILQHWPEHFFHQLRRIYIVGATFVVKIIEICSIGTFYRLCDQLFLNLAGIQDLKQADSTLMKQLGEDPSSTARPFKQSIKIIQNDLYGRSIDQYDLYSGKYPVIIMHLLSRLVYNSQQLRLEGVFRKNCDYDQLQKLQIEVRNKNFRAIQEEKDVLVVCGMLKKILNNLKLPLFNYAIYEKVIAFDGGEQKSLNLLVYSMMDYVNQKVFVLLLTFMIQYVVAQVEFNRMPAYNLSVVFGPCFFRPKEYDLKDLIYSGKFAKVLINFFEGWAAIIPEPERLLASKTLQQLKQRAIDL